jgi:hypothetical protein
MFYHLGGHNSKFKKKLTRSEKGKKERDKKLLMQHFFFLFAKILQEQWS